MRRLLTLLILLNLLSLTVSLPVSAQVHTTYLWHLQQPIYWPDASVSDPYHFQAVQESDFLKSTGGNIYSDGLAHPLNNLFDIFGKADRVAAYQYRPKDAVQTLLGYSEAGAQVSFSGCLIDNINSLADAGQWGYGSGWEGNFSTARSWTTTGGNPRMDMVGFTYHHALSPLLSDNALRKQLQTHRYLYEETWGTSPNYSKGYWPAECSFSERIIKVLVEEGFEWSIVANSHLARTLSDYPVSYGTNGTNYNPPNAADIVSTTGNNWWSGQIDARGGTFAAPYSYQAHKAQYIDPATGTPYTLTVVPMADLLSYQNGFSLMGTGDIDAHIAPFEDPAHPSIVLMAHDGDNAWGGGFDYYLNSVPGFASSAAAQGYVPTTVQQFLDDHPVPSSDIVHVEDGSWVNAANDWGHHQFINWLWPQYNSSHQFDPNGWTEDVRNFAVLTAAENHVQMAEDLAGGVDIADLVHPGPSSSNAELAWHFLLPGYTSGYMYYGTSLDMEVKQTIAGNKAISYADLEIAANPGIDNTPPNVFIPQRYPYNPGGTGYGPDYGYSVTTNPSDFDVWTLAYDVSGLSSVVLKYRQDNDGVNPMTDVQNETYAGGADVGAWTTVPMTERLMPTGNITGNPEVDFFVLPTHIASQYYAPINGLSEVLVDYYVEATDNAGNTFKSSIQHVYVGVSTPVTGGGSGDYTVSWEPLSPQPTDTVVITVSGVTQGAQLHWGVTQTGNAWTTPIAAYWPAGSVLFDGIGPAVETPFAGPGTDSTLRIVLGPLDNPAQVADRIDFVLHFDDDSWDNNGGADYHIDIDNGGLPFGVSWTPASPTLNDVVTIYVNGATQGAELHWGVTEGGTPWTTPIPAYRPAGSVLFGGTGPAVESSFSGPIPDDLLQIQVGPFDDAAQIVDGLDFVIHYADDSWDNNGGADYHMPIDNSPPNCVVPTGVQNSVIENDRAMFNWDSDVTYDHYMLRGRPQSSPTWLTILTTNNALGVSGLSDNEDYVWQVQAFCDAGGTISSDWSDTVYLHTACSAPTGLYTDGLAADAASVHWNPVNGATGYVLQSRQAGGSPLSINISDGAVSGYDFTGLSSATLYQWRLQAVCELNSEYTGIQSFTTTTLRLSADWDVSVFPNPADESTNILLSSVSGNTEVEAGTLKVYAVDGRLVYQTLVEMPGSNMLDVGTWAAGRYLLKISGPFESEYWLQVE